MDHAPARVCFDNKVGPEGFEFPACVACNRVAALCELVVALYVRMADRNPEYLNRRDFEKIVLGVANNAPDALLNPYTTANEKRRMLKKHGVALPAGEFLEDVPVVGIPEAAHGYIDIFVRKMLAAMFYRETGNMLGPTHGLMLIWAQLGSDSSLVLRSRADEWFGNMHHGQRRNIDIRGQFKYKWGHSFDQRIFGLWMEFRSALGFFAVAGPADGFAGMKHKEAVRSWAPLDEAARELNIRAS